MVPTGWRKHWIWLVLVIFYAFAALYTFMGAAEGIRLEIKPNLCFEPCTVKAIIRFAEDIPKGTPVCVFLHDDLDYSTSCWPHTGAHITDRFQIKGIPAGEYVVEVRAKGWTDARTLVVKGAEPSSSVSIPSHRAGMAADAAEDRGDGY